VTLQAPIVCLVTDRGRLGGSLERLVRLCGDAARAGASLIHLRERDLGGRALHQVASAVAAAARGTGAAVVVNDRADVAAGAGAQGVHLRSDSPSPRRVRALPWAVPPFLVGRSVRSVADAQAAAREGCDYLIFGTVFRSAGKPAGHAVAGASALEEVARAVRIPVIAIGGVTVDTAAEAARAGAAGVAGIGAFAESADVGATIAALRRAFDT